MAIGEVIMATSNGFGKFVRGIDLFRTEIFQELPLQQLKMVLCVADNEGMNQQDFQEILGVPQGTVSRNLSKLGLKVVEMDNGEMKDVGYGLLEVYPDPKEPKRNCVYLTKKGRAFVNQLKSILE
jgi:DNA-binding MarR family transcriptional regulator